jgi:hypothetical protein
MAIITPETGYRELLEEEVKQLSAANENLRSKLRLFFMEEG